MDYLENKGVYALVMHLPKEKRIQIGKLGRFDFDIGWYVYVGSAHGCGGLKARTNRHRRSDAAKKKRWNIDFLRPHVELHEIWFAAAPVESEHLFADTISHFMDATIPVPGFGSHDCRQCEAHLFRLTRRPFVATLRWMIHQSHPVHAPICVEPVADLKSRLQPILNYDPLEQSYLRGSTMLEMDHRRTVNRSGPASHGEKAECLQQRRVWKEDIERFARAMEAEPKSLKQDAAFATSVDLIVKNCPGPRTIECLLRGERPQSRDAIMKLARTSGKRQAYRVNGVITGEFRSVAPTGKDRVFDTIKYSEVISRLARARGTLEHLRPQLAAETDLSVVAECRYLLDICRRSAVAIRDNILPVPTPDPHIPPLLCKEELWDRLLSRETTGETVGRARAAVRLTIKSLWDWPESHRLRLFPTQREIAKTDAETHRIIELADEITEGTGILLHSAHSYG